MRLRTIRKIEEKAEAKKVAVLNHDARRQVWYQQAGAPDKKRAVDIVDEDFGFKEEVAP